jgi:hypothetical protein
MNPTPDPSPSHRCEQVSLAAIRTDGGSQARVRIKDQVVRDYAAAMTQQLAQGRLHFPPVVLFAEGPTFWLADGFHRFQAATAAGLSDILAEVRPGNQRDAQLFSIASNAEHGLPRTNANKRKAVGLLLEDPERRQWSDREIARHCGVSDRLVNKVRASASANRSQMRQRKARRGDQVYAMQTPANDGTARPTSNDTPQTVTPTEPDQPMVADSGGFPSLLR